MAGTTNLDLENMFRSIGGGGGAAATPTVPGVGTVQQSGYPGTSGGVSSGSPGAAGSFYGAVAPLTPNAGTTAPFVNTAERNPDISYALDKMKSRFEGDGGAAQAIDLSAGKIRDWGEGERRAAQGRRSMRGVSGTGVDNIDDRRITGDVQSKIAGGAQDIALQREKEKDAILSNIAGTGVAMANVSGASQDRALEQWRAVQENQRAVEAARNAQLSTVMSLMSSIPTSSAPVAAAAPKKPAPVSSQGNYLGAVAVRPGAVAVRA